jgi:hypothetical protein
MGVKSSTIDRNQQNADASVVALLTAAAATGAGTAKRCYAQKKAFQVFGTFVGTVAAEGSLDGTNWVSLGSLTAPGKIENEFPWTYIRGNVTAYTSGAINMNLGT